MSNPSDPNRPASPDQPDPKKPDPKKSGDADWTPPGDEKQGVTGHSSFDFVLLEGTESYSDLPPLPQPEGSDSGTNNAAVPPAPFVNPLSSQSFDFIDLPALPGDSLSGTGLGKAQPVPGDSVSVDSTMSLPAVGPVPGGGESSVGLGAVPMPAPGESSFTLGSSVADLALPPDVPDASALSTTSVPDVASVFPRPPVPGADSGSLSEFDLPLAEPVSDVFPAAPPAGPAATTPTPDLESVLGAPVKPASGWLDQSGTPPPAKAGDAPAPPASEAPRTPMSRSSFDFALPEGVSTYSDMPPVPQPDVGETALNQSALPPRPTATRPASNTFDFIDLPDAPSGSTSGSGLKNVSATPTPIEPPPAVEPPLLTPTDSVIDLPSPAAQEPVAPVAGWLDSDVAPAQPAPAAEPVAEPTAELFEASPVAEPVESSDIFSGSRTAEALPVEQSDVIAATAFSGPASATPSGPAANAARPSDVALNFDAPPGGSTLADSDIPVADAAADSSTLLGEPGHDPESIHDMPGMSVPDPLFDSSKLAETPDLPAEPAGHDAPAYGAMPGYDPDASSILADLSDPDVRDPGADSSSVRVDSPEGARTLGAEPAEGTFDLTVPEEPIPADLFGEPSEGAAAEATDWHSRSGSDLFAQGGTARADADLVSGPSSASNIFSGDEPPSPAGSGSVQADATEPADLDAAEFSDAPELGATAETRPEAPRRPAHGLSSADFALPPAAQGAADAIDWDAAELAAGDEAPRGEPNDTSLSSVLRGLNDASTEVRTKDARPIPAADDTSTPVVTVDWMAGSAEGSAVKEPVKAEAKERKDKAPPREEKAKDKPAKEPKKQPAAEVKAKPERAAPRAAVPAAPVEAEKPAEAEKARPAKKGGGMLVGMLAGALLAGGACAGVYFGGLVPNEKGGTAKVGQPPVNPNPGNNTPTPAPGSARDAFAAGNFTNALKHLKDNEAKDLDERATAGSVRIFAKIAGAGSDDDLKKGREDLQAVIDDPGAAKDGPEMKRAVKATVDLGASYEAAGDAAAAKKLFTEAKAKYQPYADLFDALLDRLDAPPAGGAGGVGGTSFRAPRLTPADAERALLAASILLLQDPPAPKAGDDPEPGQFYWKALKLARAGSYDEAIKLIDQAKEAHVKRAKAFAGRGLNPLTDPLEQMFPRACDELAENWKLRAELYRNKAVADAIKKDGLGKTLDTLAKSQADLAKAQTDLKAEKDNLAKAKADLKTADDNLKAEQKKVTNLEADLAKLDKQAKADRLAANKAIDAAKTDVKALEKKLGDTSETLLAAQKDAKDRGEALNRVAKELAPAVKLPEKWTAADLTAAVKNLASVANDKDAKGLLERVTKAEAVAKAATAKLATELKKLKADHEADVKTLTDTYKADRKKLEDASAAEIKKLADKLAADTKKLRDDHAADVKKLNEEHATALKAEQARTEAEKRAAAIKEVTFQKQLANAVTPAQAVDIWLPVLTDLRRESDAAPALAMANKSLESSPVGSEEEAKARTLKGMALLLKRDYPAAREEFQAAKRSPAYKEDKLWAKVADAGLEATEDPLALYRQPVAVPPVDVVSAARSLDAGVAAYRARKYQAAVAALTEAAKNDPADPVAWYYLGAARLAQGDAKQAEKDIAQGSEREKNSPKPGRAISDALAPIQGRARDAIDKARP